MNEFLLYSALALMLGTAVLSVVTDRLFTAVIYAGVLSAVAAFVYLLLGAPDVALAEAVIGSTLATVIFLATLRKYRMFTIYQTGRGKQSLSDRALAVIARALQKQEIESHVLRSSASPRELLTRANCDLVVERRGDEIIVHGEQDSQYLPHLLDALRQENVPVALQDSLASSMADYKEGDRV